ncbi:hypothetical protein Bbelb_393360 [Branchiostoma belcheri]|nr:hypothetical protein Bbelb_393360 [Branchiostoma belcheri]
MVTVLDEAVDNGAKKGKGSNWPLRGWKNTLWEGGVRAVGFVNSNLLEKKGRINRGGWKHQGPSHNMFDKPKEQPDKHIWLFNIRNDPQEKNDLSDRYPVIVLDMLEKLSAYNKTAVPPFWPPRDPRANPALHGDLWGPWI